MSGKVTARRRTTASLNALRAFEAVARLGRVGLAARELNVTHGAISRQMRILEESLDLILFTGPKHDQALTEAGAALAARLTQGFEIIEAAVAEVAGPADVLPIACHASIAGKWLIPRLAAFTEAHPQVRLSLQDLPPAEIAAPGAKGSILILTREPPAGYVSVPFMSNHVGLVCTPGLAQRFGRDGPNGAPRLVSDTRPAAFAEWAEAGGLPLEPAEPLRFSHLHFMIEAALAGVGVAIAPWTLVADDVVEGRLTAPYGFVEAGGAFALVRQEDSRDRPLRAFEDWLISEGARTPPAPMA